MPGQILFRKIYILINTVYRLSVSLSTFVSCTRRMENCQSVDGQADSVQTLDWGWN